MSIKHGGCFLCLGGHDEETLTSYTMPGVAPMSEVGIAICTPCTDKHKDQTAN